MRFVHFAIEHSAPTQCHLKYCETALSGTGVYSETALSGRGKPRESVNRRVTHSII